MSDKIAQHKHCRACGKAFVGSGRFCSEECRTSNTTNLQKKKRQLLLLYVVTFVVLVLALVATWG